jgi:hypothetical protein
MRKIIVVAVGAALAAGAALLALSLAAFASASTRGTTVQTSGTTARTISFTAKTIQATQIDLPPAGFGQGDEAVFHDELISNGNVIGYDGGSCQATFVPKGQVPQFQCFDTFVLPGGQITIQGLFNIANTASFSGSMAVTGGTGAYQQAQGQGTIDQTSATIATITLSLTPPQGQWPQGQWPQGSWG